MRYVKSHTTHFIGIGPFEKSHKYMCNMNLLPQHVCFDSIMTYKLYFERKIRITLFKSFEKRHNLT